MHFEASVRRRPRTHPSCDLCCASARQWLKALKAHIASIPSSFLPDASDASPPAPLLPDLATAQSRLSDEHERVEQTLQDAIHTLRANQLSLVSDASPPTSTPTKRRKTAHLPQTPDSALAGVRDEEVEEVVAARAAVLDELDEVGELLERERLELKELHTFLDSHPSQHSSAAEESEAAAGGNGLGSPAGVGAEVSRAGSGGAVSTPASGSSSGSAGAGNQLSSPNSGHSKQVAAGLAKRLNRSAGV